jgi:hypothetical protein
MDEKKIASGENEVYSLLTSLSPRVDTKVPPRADR